MVAVPEPPVLICVVSHPRSGTHLTIDFLRRAFPSLNRRLSIWNTDQWLYVDLDKELRPEERRVVPDQYRKIPYLVAKTHLLGFKFDCDFVEAMFPRHKVIYIYPFRSLEKTAASYHRFCSNNESLSEFMSQPDPYFGTGLSVAEAMKTHACRNAYAHALSVDDLIGDPSAAIRALERITPLVCNPKATLPKNRRIPGLAGVLLHRITGRQSTEVLVEGPNEAKPSESEMRSIRTMMRDLNEILDRRKINPNRRLSPS
jgi:hypothetical protein